MTSFEEFKALSSAGNVIPLFEILPSDTETPVSLFLKTGHDSTYSFLLESVEGGETIGRYSFIGFNPFMKFAIHDRKFTIEALHDDVRVLPALVLPTDEPLFALKKLFGHIKTVRTPGLPRLCGGAIGYFGYDCIRLIEDVPSMPDDAFSLPDALLLFYDVVIVIDNVKHQMFVVSNAYLPEGNHSDEDLRYEYKKALMEIDRIKRLLEIPVAPGISHARLDGSLKHITSRSDFLKNVERCREYISDGDIFQVVLSQRIEQQAELRSFDLYRALRSINPSPYMYYLRCGEFDVVGASPEMLIRVEEGAVETRPIAGTRRRGATPEEDARLEVELMNDPKERAEHLMLVDLGRNDVGKISEYGSVVVDQYMCVEKYSHVMHLVSSVHGKLRPGLSAIDALLSCFPAGTLTGAPKIRAMEIIAELEPVKRGVYGGAVAYIDFTGNLDSCIAIRTIVVKGNTMRFQAGAGIVFDSDPEREYKETLEKLDANFRAVEKLAGPHAAFPRPD
jgi:anthranilate synthase component I